MSEGCETCSINGEACPGGVGHDVCPHGNPWPCCSECGCYCKVDAIMSEEQKYEELSH